MSWKGRVLLGAIVGVLAFDAAAFFAAPSKSPATFAIASALGLVVGAFLGLTIDPRAR